MKLAIIGGGSWGTALAMVLAPRSESLRLWVYEADLAARMATRARTMYFFPAFACRMPSRSSGTAAALGRRYRSGRDAFAPRAQHLFCDAAASDSAMILVSATRVWSRAAAADVASDRRSNWRKPRRRPIGTDLSRARWPRNPTAVVIASSMPRSPAASRKRFPDPPSACTRTPTPRGSR